MTLLTDTLNSLWQVVAIGLLFGAGLPALFALGLRSLAAGSADGSDAPTLVGKIGATVCFAIIVVAVASGILLLTEDFLSSTFGIKVF
ncbi:MAG: hypothetical protein GX610_20660 [Rhodococcus sp.]|nr:hypothetical protein [Rhodococcus sp. (in: high G+C Gram-positive bacteria)]